LRTNQSFFVPVADIHANNYDLSINRYKEVIHEQKEYEKPEVIIAQIEQLDEERKALLEELKELLSEDEEVLSMAAEPEVVYSRSKASSFFMDQGEEYLLTIVASHSCTLRPISSRRNNLNQMKPLRYNEMEKVKLGNEIKVRSGVNLIQEKMDKNGEYLVYGGNGVTGKHSSFNVNEPTIIIGRVGYYCGSVHLTTGKTWVTDNAFITKFSYDTFDLKFLYYALRQCNLRQYSNSSAQPVISGGGISGVEIVCPPLHIQQQIADTLDKADALRQKDQQLLQKYDGLAQSIFYDMFGDPVKNERGWKTMKLGMLSNHVSSGSTPLGGQKVYQASGTLFIRSQNVLMRKFDVSDAVFIPNETHNKMKRTWVKIRMYY
jgi:hypothetical protein